MGNGKNINAMIEHMLSVPQVQYKNVVSENELCNCILSCVLSLRNRKTKADQYTIASLKKRLWKLLMKRDH